MRRGTGNTHSFKCHYCGGGRETSYSIRNSASRSMSRIHTNTTSAGFRSKSLNGGNASGFLPQIKPTNNDHVYIRGKAITEDDVKAELVDLKKRYAALDKQHAILKTHLQVTTNDVKKREREIENLLQENIANTKVQRKLELNSLRRKVLQYERVLRQKSVDIEALMNDKNLVVSHENSIKLARLEREYQQLRRQLINSVPLDQLENEKAKMTDLIGKLQRENQELHTLCSTVLNNPGGDEGMPLSSSSGIRDARVLEKMRNEATLRQREVENYQKALNMLIRERSNLDTSALSRHPQNQPFRHGKSLNTGDSSSFAQTRNLKKGVGNRGIRTATQNAGHIEITDSDMANNQISPKKDSRTSKKKAKRTATDKSSHVESQNNDLHISEEFANLSVATPVTSSAYPTEHRNKDSKKNNGIINNGNETSHNKVNGELLEYDEVTNPNDYDIDDDNDVFVVEDNEETPPATPNQNGEKTPSRNASLQSDVTNHEDDVDMTSNIEAIHDEYDEKVQERGGRQLYDEQISNIIVALRCHLLREEMCDTRVHTY